MNLNFLNPAFLAGLLAISAPILIHLLTRRQQRRIRFSAIYLLLQSQKRAFRRSRPNRLLLLIIRCLAIALLSLALASPIFSFGGPEELISSAPSANVFILDDSYSMGLQTEDGTLYSKAVEALMQPIGKISPKSVYSIITASSPAKLILDWTQDPQAAGKILKGGKSSFKTTSIGQAITMANNLLESASQKEKRIFVFTDREKNGWREQEFPESPPSTPYSIRIIDFSALAPEGNRASVEEVETRQEFLTNSRMMRVKARVRNVSQSGNLPRQKISLLINGKQQSEGSLNIPPGKAEEKEFSFPLQGNEPVNGRILTQEDALPVDNQRFFTYQPDQKINVLVVDGDPKTVAHQSETFYLERALNPFSAALSNIVMTVSTLEELEVRNLLDYAVVILCNVRDLPLGYEVKLENYVMRGGALFIALGDQIDPKFYNEKLGNLLPVQLKSLQQVGPQDKPFRFLVEPSDHPVLKIFKDKTLEEMKNIRFNSFYSVEPREGRKYMVPMWFRNKYPALIESDYGKGKVILFTSTIDRDWNNFPIQPTFLPWMQRWVKYSARGLETIQRKNLLVGEPFHWSDDFSASTPFVRTPGGKILRLYPSGEKAVFTETFTPGIYHLFRSPGSRTKPVDSDESRKPDIVGKLPETAIPVGAFTINVDTRESDPEKITDQEIRNLLKGAQVEFSTGKRIMEPVAAEKGIPLTTPFLVLSACMLLLEGWLVRRE